MRKRLLALTVVLGFLAVPGYVLAGTSGSLRPYSPEWLAKYHTRYDNQVTARYESQVGYGKGTSGAFGAWHAPAIANVRMSGNTLNGNQNEFQIDINPLDHNFAIGASNDSVFSGSGTGYFRTSDGGQTWVSADMPVGQTSCCDPGVAYSDTGVAYFVNLDTSPPAFFVKKTTDNGVTWTNATKITPGDDRENIVVDNGSTSPHHGRVYVTYSDFGTTGPTNEIKLYYSDNQGTTWTGPVNVSHTGLSGAPYAQSSQPRVANDGTVYVGFQFYPTGLYASAQDKIAKSTDGGVTFQPATIISSGPHLQGGLDLGDARGYFATNSSCTTFRHRSFPIIGVDPTNSNNVYATWAGGNLEQPYTCGGSSGYHSDVLFSKSTDGGTTWSAPLKVNDDPPGKDQYYPWMDVAPNGTIWIGWHDRRNDPNNFKHVWYMDRSTNGGTSFGTDFRIGTFRTQPSDFIGDYAGLAVENDVVLPMWWDSRSNASGDPYTAVIHPHQLG